MLKGKELILATKTFASENRFKSWLYTLSTFFLLIGMIAGAIFLVPVTIRIICCILITLLLVRIFTIYHDYLHGTILQKSKIAKFIFFLVGFYMLNPPSIWKRSHDHHHKHNSKLYTSSIGSYPIVTREKFLSMSKKDQFYYLFIRHPLTIAFGYIFTFFWGMTLLSLFRNPSKHWDGIFALILHFGIGISILLKFGWLAFLLAFLFPAILSSAIGSYLFYAQHNFPGATFKDKDGWTYHEAALQSSSYMKMSKIMEWFTGNIGYHHIHHANARIPFYSLPAVYNTFPEFRNAKITSLHPSDIYRCLQLKVWDPDLQRMLMLKEIRNQ